MRGVRSVQAAVKSGRISKARLDAFGAPNSQAESALGLPVESSLDVNAINQKFASVAWQKEAQEISDRG